MLIVIVTKTNHVTVLEVVLVPGTLPKPQLDALELVLVAVPPLEHQ